ncbi:uncharacterized protein [Coffea arabica]|uniref:DUF7769 domain-containing protein n=1 Tax=Coffea arabica TaxID=13443 RepID=A0A6P6TEQ3_COFAR|nr:uncharacterized protein LOC113700698 [Coffea arabica]
MENSSIISAIDLNILPENVSSTLQKNTFIDLNHLPEDDVFLADISTDAIPINSFSPQYTIRHTSIDLNQVPEDANSPGSYIAASENTRQPMKKKNFTTALKRAIYEMLLKECENGKLSKGVISRVAECFDISTRSVSRIWHEGKCTATAYGHLPNLSPKLVKRVGRKKIQVNLEDIKDIPFRRRTNIRSLAKALDVSKSSLHRRIKEESLRPHSNPVKPYLSTDSKKARLQFCLSMISEGTLASKFSFDNMHDRIHIDEKWFYMSKTSQRYYLHPLEHEPYRTCKSKRFVPKLMFLAAVARPRYDITLNKQFNGKIGIWPFVFKEPAKRNSKNRTAGTLETKPILSITKDVIRSCLIEKLLPAIREKWPCSSSKMIFIQQDNAKPHLGINDDEFVEAAKIDGFDIRLCCQPANSPDMNVLDLGFFRAIDSLQHQKAPSTIDEFVSAVEKAFDMFPSEDLNKVFLTLQLCMVEVIKICGGNNYKIPHMNKEKYVRNGQLPDCIECESQVVNEAKIALSKMD